jgi:hypothetical protein
MALSITPIFRQFKVDGAKAVSPETLTTICGHLHCTWRDRLLDPVTTGHVFLVQILHGNTACTALPRLALFEELLQEVCDAWYPEVHNSGRWRGHRTWHIDGSSFSMPDTAELQTHFDPIGLNHA